MCTKKNNKKVYKSIISNLLSGIWILVFITGYTINTFAQSDEFANDPITGTFETGILAETQTTETPFKGEFEFHVQHRFGLIENGFEDVFGIYATSNIRMGVNYGVTPNFMIGYGYTKEFKLQEFHGKYRVLTQTESNSIPVSVALYANLAINSQNKSVFGNDYVFSDRLAYFSQILVAHKFNDNFSLQFGPSFTHFNKTDSLVEHDKFALSLAGRARISPSMSVFVEYDQPLNIDDMREYKSDENDPEANLSFGIEIGTSTHVFQVFMSNYDGITPQRNTLFNKNKIGDGDFLVGFNILVRF